MRVDGEAAGPDGAGAGDPRPDFVMERFGKLHDAGRTFDVEYWQRQGDEAIFEAAWELAELHHGDQGMNPDELQLQRLIEHFERP